MSPLPLGLRKILACVAVLLLAGNFSRAADATTVVWKLDDVKKIAGQTTEVLGAPQVVEGAMVFDGAKDGVFVPVNALMGLKAFTIEVLFSPAAGGPAEQRFLHMQDAAGSRMLMEIRLTPERQWSLDTFLLSGTHSLALLDRKKEHAADAWHWAVLRYDGKTMTSFVDGVQELQGEVAFEPMGAGQTSVGVRQNKVYWFKGAIREVRVTPAALPVEKLQRVK